MSALADLFIKAFGDLIVDKTKSAINIVGLKTWQQARWIRAADAYREKAERLHSVISPIGTRDKQVDVRDIYTFLHFISKTEAEQNYSKAEIERIVMKRGRHQVKQVERIAASEILSQHPKLFVLGQPGSGKTTLLRKALLAGLDNKLPHDLLPVFVELRNLNLNPDWKLIDLVAEQFEICNFPKDEIQSFLEYMLEKGKMFILIDGLDELPQERNKRSAIHHDIKTFTQKYDLCRFIVTSRIASTKLHLKNFSYLEIAPFDQYQVDSFIENWFSNDKSRSMDFRRKLTDYKSMDNLELDLIRNPLLLSMLCVGFEMEGTLSLSRGLVYRNSVQHIFDNWDNSRAGLNNGRGGLFANLAFQEKVGLIADIAFRSFKSRQIIWTQRKLQKQIGLSYLHVTKRNVSVKELDWLLTEICTQTGLFVERAKGIYSFVHLSFHEYFVAEYISMQISSAGTDINFGRNAQWREVMLYLVDLTTNEDELQDLFAVLLDDYRELLRSAHVIQVLFVPIYEMKTYIDQPRVHFAKRLYSYLRVLQYLLNKPVPIDAAWMEMWSYSSNLIYSSHGSGFFYEQSGLTEEQIVCLYDVTDWESFNPKRMHDRAGNEDYIEPNYENIFLASHALDNAISRSCEFVQILDPQLKEILETEFNRSLSIGFGIENRMMRDSLEMCRSLIMDCLLEIDKIEVFGEIAHESDSLNTNFEVYLLSFLAKMGTSYYDEAKVQIISQSLALVNTKNWEELWAYLFSMNKHKYSRLPSLALDQIESIAEFAFIINLIIECLLRSKLCLVHKDEILNSLLTLQD